MSNGMSVGGGHSKKVICQVLGVWQGLNQKSLTWMRGSSKNHRFDNHPMFSPVSLGDLKLT